MAEQTPSSNGDSSEFLRKRTHQEKQAGGSRALPPKRGLLKRSKDNAAPGRADASRRVMRTPISNEQTGPRPPVPVADTSHLSPPTPPSLQSAPAAPTPPRPTQAKSGRPTSARPPVNPNIAEKTEVSADRLEKRLVEAEDRKKAQAEKTKQQTELKAARQAERDRKAELRAQAQKKAEEVRIQQQKELQLRKAEAARIKLEKEAEVKRLEEERRVKEREAEAIRLEEERVFQEQESHRIFKNIETYQGKLSEKDQELAKTIAEEMVKRKIHWEGYISLHSGIGGSMLS